MHGLHEVDRGLIGLVQYHIVAQDDANQQQKSEAKRTAIPYVKLASLIKGVSDLRICEIVTHDVDFVLQGLALQLEDLICFLEFQVFIEQLLDLQFETDIFFFKSLVFVLQFLELNFLLVTAVLRRNPVPDFLVLLLLDYDIIRCI